LPEKSHYLHTEQTTALVTLSWRCESVASDLLQIEKRITMRKAKTLTALAGIAIAALALTGCAPADEETVEPVETSEVEEAPTEEATTEAPGDIIDAAVGAGTFTTLAAALAAADLVTTLQGDGPFTVFAPTDEAFAALPAGLLDALLLPENVGVLQAILTYHVVSGTVLAADVTTGDVPTVEGSNIAVDTSMGVVLNGTANVTATDIMASNGVIHVIDAVILPPGLDVTPLLG
jgi:uncharacterized surface protein with fasciclin (FAS1) repeats